MVRWTFGKVQQRFRARGYQLLSTEYVNSHSKLDYICPQGHRGQICRSDFEKGHGCSVCAGNRRYTISQLKRFFAEEGYVLLSKDYRGCQKLLEYECPQGHIGKIRWNSFQQGYRCATCSNKKKKTIEQVRCFFKQEGYQLLSTVYKNTRGLLYYQCPKGHKGKISWNRFSSGQRCAQCKNKGEQKLGEILEKIFPGQVRAQDNLDFLGKQKVDYSVRDLRLAFEYDGRQHFEPVDYGCLSEKQAKKNFQQQQKWDACKNRLCQENGYVLIRISYRDMLDVGTVKTRMSIFTS